MPHPYSGAHQRLRKAAIDNLIDGTLCPICGKPMTKVMKLHYDHVIPVSQGGDPAGKRRLVHAACNLSRGGKLGAAIIHGKSNPKPKPKPRANNRHTVKRVSVVCALFKTLA